MGNTPRKSTPVAAPVEEERSAADAAVAAEIDIQLLDCRANRAGSGEPQRGRKRTMGIQESVDTISRIRDTLDC